ncbi:hypothetical protein CDA63_11685 [Hymenobacter amundsenii]|uniref:Uncharacterized protein n=1 Tax=Hymenobacter amundsenii TaxID=2006685 RepID=A0A246FJZ0_9BACT|nr:hypothetical protein CDA63_11685 [Hymenobacter amundsenii]
MGANQNESLSTLVFTLNVLTNKLKRLPVASAEFTRCTIEALDINDKIQGLRAALCDGRE